MGFPVSRLSTSASVRASARSAWAMPVRMRPRSDGRVAAQAGWRARADCTARSTSALLPTVTSAKTSPVEGLIDGHRSVADSDATWPSMNASVMKEGSLM